MSLKNISVHSPMINLLSKSLHRLLIHPIHITQLLPLPQIRSRNPRSMNPASQSKRKDDSRNGGNRFAFVSRVFKIIDIEDDEFGGLFAHTCYDCHNVSIANLLSAVARDRS